MAPSAKPNAAARPSTAAVAQPDLAADRAAADGTFPVVGLGASAGGLEALQQFLSHVPPDSGMAYVVVQHLDPDHQGMLPELLQRVTPMPVAQVRHGAKVQPDHVYVIPPNRDLSILHGRLRLLAPAEPRGLRLPIDAFLRALAADRGAHAVGVILSGMGSDGTFGLRAIKEQGGLALVQTPATAKFDSMPRGALHFGLADIVAAPEELPLRIVESVRQTFAPVAPGTGSETVAQRSALEKICILLRAHTTHDFSHYKKNTLYRRIERRMGIHQIRRIADYVRYLHENPHEIDLLFKELLIGVTSFFRDPAAWDYLQQHALPQLLAARPSGAALRAWVAGCSTGEEAYTLAIVFRELLVRNKLQGRYSLQIFATDLDADAIDRARRGQYPSNIAADVSDHRLAHFFVEEPQGYRVSKDIREMVVFASQSVIADPPFTRMDILSCRNLMIYLDADSQKKLLPLFHYSLNPGGILMLGTAESIGGFTELFTPLDGRQRLFRRAPGPMPTGDLAFPTRSAPMKTDPTPQAHSEPPPSNLQSVADQLLLQRFSPAAVLVNASGDLLYVSGRTGRYLEPAAGKANWNIHVMARDGLRQEIAVALPKALRTGERVVSRNLHVVTENGGHVVDLTVQPIDEPSSLRGMAMLVFSDVAAASPAPKGTRGKSTRPTQREAELERELTLTRQELLTAREEMQASQEELKSANEELQSTNEELQSTNEELTTSKEEMQSLNEELQTVNSELQAKVDELSATSNDMKNLLNSTDIATVFLDNGLGVRRYTTQAASIFKLIPGDVGRPLFDLVNDLDYPDLAADAREVLRSLVPSKRQIPTRDGRWYEVRLLPYRTTENVIDGVVITFIDITVGKRLEQELRKALEGRRQAG